MSINPDVHRHTGRFGRQQSAGDVPLPECGWQTTHDYGGTTLSALGAQNTKRAPISCSPGRWNGCRVLCLVCCCRGDRHRWVMQRLRERTAPVQACRLPGGLRGAGARPCITHASRMRHALIRGDESRLWARRPAILFDAYFAVPEKPVHGIGESSFGDAHGAGVSTEHGGSIVVSRWGCRHFPPLGPYIERAASRTFLQRADRRRVFGTS
jgi:hypothetical protein